MRSIFQCCAVLLCLATIASSQGTGVESFFKLDVTSIGVTSSYKPETDTIGRQLNVTAVISRENVMPRPRISYDEDDLQVISARDGNGNDLTPHRKLKNLTQPQLPEGQSPVVVASQNTRIPARTASFSWNGSEALNGISELKIAAQIDVPIEDQRIEVPTEVGRHEVGGLGSVIIRGHDPLPTRSNVNWSMQVEFEFERFEAWEFALEDCPYLIEARVVTQQDSWVLVSGSVNWAYTKKGFNTDLRFFVGNFAEQPQPKSVEFWLVTKHKRITLTAELHDVPIETCPE